MAKLSKEKLARAEMLSSNEDAIAISEMNKWFGSFHVLRDINLSVKRGERIVVAGPSGSGKSTLIRCVNRLEEHQSGKIVVDGTELTSDLKNIDKVRSEVGMVFQHFNLFPHLTILENCTLAPLWVRKTPKKEADEIAMGFLEKVKIPEQADKYPGQLSGGQQQRVAIARAILKNPSIFFFDEATSALDSTTEKEIQKNLQTISQNRTTLVIAHRLSTAADADEILVLEQGKITERGTHDELLSRDGKYAEMWNKQKDTQVIQDLEATSVLS